MKYMSTQGKPQIRAVVYLLLLLIIGIAGTLISSPGGGVFWPPPTTNHTASIAEIWTLSDIYIGSGLQPQILIVNNKVIVLGSDNISQKESNILAFDARTGQMAWRVAYDGIVITQHGSKIIVGGIGKIMALDSDNGESIWERSLQSNVNRIVVKDNLLYAFGASSSHYYEIDADNGEVLKRLEGTTDSIFQEVALENLIFRKTGKGEVVVVSQVNNEELWRYNANVISNLTADSPSFIYALNRDGDLLKFDYHTSSVKNLLKFSPAPLLYSNEVGGFEYSYYLARDQRASLLFVYLGDSAQLFAFHIQ